MTGFLSKIRRLYGMLGRHKRAALVTCVLTILAAVVESFGISMIMPIMQVIVEGTLQGQMAELLNPFLAKLPARFLLPALCLLFFGFLFLKFIFSMLRIFVSKRFVWCIRLEWLNRLYEKYLFADYTYLLNNKQGVMLHNLIDETHRGAICLAQLTEYLAKLVLLAALYVPLLVISWQTTLVLSLAIGALLAATHTISKKYARTAGQKRLKFRQQLSGWAMEGVGGVRQVKIFGLERWFLKKFSAVSHNLYHVELRFDIIQILPTYLSELVLGLFLVIVITYISFFTDIQINTLLPAIGVYIVVGQRISSNISLLAGLRLQILALLPSLSLAYDLSSEAIRQETLEKGMRFDRLEQDIEFRQVNFSYEQGKKVLSDLDLVIRYRKMTAVVGQSGAGKSTLADLILGLYSPQSGKILINGRDIPEWKLKSWRSCIGYVSQEPYLFNMSIRDNIAITCPGVSGENIEDAARRAYAHDFIMKLSEGYDTIVGDRGLKLSGGQRQRIVIARALVRDPDLFIFDEATSALDKESEQMVQKAIAEIATEKTILVIAHRLSTIESADAVYTLDEKTN